MMSDPSPLDSFFFKKRLTECKQSTVYFKFLKPVRKRRAQVLNKLWRVVLHAVGVTHHVSSIFSSFYLHYYIIIIILTHGKTPDSCLDYDLTRWHISSTHIWRHLVIFIYSVMYFCCSPLEGRGGLLKPAHSPSLLSPLPVFSHHNHEASY